MRKPDIQELLVGANLREDRVSQMLDELEKMQRCFQQTEYAELATTNGRFCENAVEILQDKCNEECDSHIRKFAADLIHGNVNVESMSEQKHTGNMLQTAWDIRNERDAVHVNLGEPVRRTDARLSIALCSSIVVELIHEFVSDENDIELDEVASIIEDLSTPEYDNKFDKLVESRDEFDLERVVNKLEGRIVMVQEKNTIKPGPDFNELIGSDPKTIALLLARLAAYDQGHIEKVGIKPSWFAKHQKADENAINNHLKNYDFVDKDWNRGGYYIPGYHVDNALERIPDPK